MKLASSCAGVTGVRGARYAYVGLLPADNKRDVACDAAEKAHKLWKSFEVSVRVS